MFYASIGKVRTTDSKYPYFMREFNCSKIRDVLIEEQLLKLGSAEECLYVYPYKALQSFLKLKKIDPGNGRDITIKRIIEYKFTNDVANTLGYLCYIPLETAKHLYEMYTVNDFYKMDFRSELREKSYERYKVYTKHDNKVTVSISKDGDMYVALIKKDNDITELRKYNDLVSKCCVNLYVENQFVKRFENINYIFFLPLIHVVIFVENSFLYVYQPFDFLNFNILPLYRHESLLWNVLEYNDFHQEKYKSKHSVLEKGYINYYVSSDNFTKLIMKEIFFKLGKRILINDIKTKIVDEEDDNYVIRVRDNDIEMRKFIIYLFKMNHLHFPTIMHTRIENIFTYMRYNLYIDVPIKQLLVQEYNAEHEYILPVIMELDKLGICTIDDFINASIEIYPLEVVLDGDYRWYTVPRGSFQKDIYYKELIGKEDQYKVIYDRCLLKLKELKLIPARWKNEFELYLSIRKIHKDAVYQYRDSWLGLQSLDIYIPSMNIGVEYQGKQHYEIVDYFGGEKGYKLRVHLDAKKRQLCQEKGVLLMEWPYTEEVTDKSVVCFLNNAKSEKEKLK